MSTLIPTQSIQKQGNYYCDVIIRYKSAVPWVSRVYDLYPSCSFKVTGYSCAVRNVLGNVYLSSLTKNLWYEQREQLDSGSAGHDGSFFP